MWMSAWVSHQVLMPRAGSVRRCSQGRQIASIRMRASGCLYHSGPTAYRRGSRTGRGRTVRGVPYRALKPSR